MPIRHVLRPDEGYVEVIWSGVITAADLYDGWSAVLADPEVLRIGRALADVRDADLRFSGRELADAVQAVMLPVLEGRNWRSAIVVRGSLQFGVTRQYQVFSEQFGSTSIFSDRPEALAWLLKPEA